VLSIKVEEAWKKKKKQKQKKTKKTYKKNFKTRVLERLVIWSGRGRAGGYAAS
jgi:predicted RNA-binding protein with RPS1 domain